MFSNVSLKTNNTNRPSSPEGIKKFFNLNHSDSIKAINSNIFKPTTFSFEITRNLSQNNHFKAILIYFKNKDEYKKTYVLQGRNKTNVINIAEYDKAKKFHDRL